MAQGLNRLLNTALDGLQANSYGLQVTGNNVANVNSPGYARREAILETRGQGLLGVHVLGLRRITDTHVEARQLGSHGLASAASERDQNLAGIEALYDDAGGTGFGDAVGALFSSFSALATNPSDGTARATVLSRAQHLASRVSDTANGIAQTRSELFTKAQAVTGEVNDRAKAIATLNRAIAAAKANGAETANLEDQRQRVLLDLSTMVDVKTINQDSGALLVQSAGVTLVDEMDARTFSVDLAPGGNLRLLSQAKNGPPTDVTRFLTGGKLAGIKEARDTDLAAAASELDSFAFQFANAVNAQHAAGYGLDGVNGRQLFSVTATAQGAARALAVSSDVAGQPNRIAASGSATSLPGGSDNAVRLSALAQGNIVGGRTAAQAYGDLVGAVGQMKQSSADNVVLRQAVADQADAMRESASGVSLEEEMVALTKFQRAYEASAKVITTVDELLKELMLRLGR